MAAAHRARRRQPASCCRPVAASRGRSFRGPPSTSPWAFLPRTRADARSARRSLPGLRIAAPRALSMPLPAALPRRRRWQGMTGPAVSRAGTDGLHRGLHARGLHCVSSAPFRPLLADRPRSQATFTGSASLDSRITFGPGLRGLLARVAARAPRIDTSHHTRLRHRQYALRPLGNRSSPLCLLSGPHRWSRSSWS